MNSKNQKQLKIFHYLFFITIMIFVSVNFSFAQGCDMGNAYSLTEMWVQEEDLHTYNHQAILSEPLIVANGVVESDYNTCGHEYSTTTTMTLPDNSTVEGAQTNIIIDGTYFSRTQLTYYCPTAGREFEGEESFNELEFYGGVNDIYYGYTSSSYYNLYLKFCYFRACYGTDQNPSNGCFGPSYIPFTDIVNASSLCHGGVRNSYQRYRIPIIGGSFCSRIGHYDFPQSPCLFGTL